MLKTRVNLIMLLVVGLRGTFSVWWVYGWICGSRSPIHIHQRNSRKICVYNNKKNWYTVCVESVDRVVVGVFRYRESGQCHVPDTCVICGASKPWDKCKYVVFTYMIHRRVKSVFFVSSVALWGVRQCNVRKTLSPHKCFAFTSV